MKSIRIRKFALTAVVLVGLTSGCIFENILTAGAKVLNGQISQLSANEIKILNQTAAGIINTDNPGSVPILTDLQAQAVSDFLVANSLDTFEEFEALAAAAAQDPTAVQGLEALANAFEGSEGQFDPDNPDASLQELLEAIFGGSDGFDDGGQNGGNNGGNTGGTGNSNSN